MIRDLILSISLGLGMEAYIYRETHGASIQYTCSKYALLQEALHQVSIYDTMVNRSCKARILDTPWIGGVLLIIVLNDATMKCYMETIPIRIEVG